MEIVAPAGNLEKLQYALAYNADAVYLAGQQFGLRAFAGNFTLSELRAGVEYAHALNKKVYLTLNIFSRNADLEALPEYLQEIKQLPLDAVIVSEPGTLSLVKKYTDFPIHLSTQANTTNWQAVSFWKELGLERIILAREVSYFELLEIKDKVPDMELEVFIHGAMCMAWSGRCLMSALLNDRSANLGQCTHPCRWEWNLTEPTRPGQVFSIQEDDHVSYLMHSKDLCLLKEIPLLNSAGITAGKIEGRMKSTYYTALMSRIYSEARCLKKSESENWQQLAQEVSKVNHRPYFTAFFYSGNEEALQSQLPDLNLDDYSQEWQFCGKTTHSEDGLVWFDCLSKIESGDTVQIIFPDRKNDVSLTVNNIYDDEKNLVSMTKPNRSFALKVDVIKADWGLVRKLDK
ncbi:MAG: U32 family peptidase [Bacteroidia bacterium]|nr:MAG: U32 family peptidase [Bacteroidia bacterium]